MITMMEVSFVEKYFDRIHTDTNVLSLVDRVLKNLKFFKRMRETNRKEILFSSKLIVSQPQEFVIRQGEIGNHMYVIIKGWVNVKIEAKYGNKKEQNQPKEPILMRQIVTLYDGDHFGEIALIDLEQKEDISVLSPPK